MKTGLLPPEQRPTGQPNERVAAAAPRRGIRPERLRSMTYLGRAAVWRKKRDAPSPIIDLVKLAAALAAAAVLGLAATYFSIERHAVFGAVQAGVWTVWPKIGSNGVNPYELAALARTGEVPLGLSEGLMFTARRDDSGALLSGRCVYRVGGPVPAGRFWTLTPLSSQGYLIANRAKRYGFSSQEIVRQADGRFQITISRAAGPGNWLPIGDVERFELALRIYDTTLSATAATLDKTLMPSVTRESCA